jgi:hypothetical protein
LSEQQRSVRVGTHEHRAKSKLLELLAQQEAEVETTPQQAPEEARGQWHSVVGELEAAHPEATGFMNRLATALANMGI